ncbi:deoxyguanosinetriphosphate triphosphohydrolase family protein [Candidatus Margulisiibacteriota bacterium]
MKKHLFQKERINEENPNWPEFVAREEAIYKKAKDIRSEFERDYTRILHCTAYRRLKHKTQVFYAVQNDHICTRMEHVNMVASVSHTIANFLGLNTDVTKAIATGHDLGHAPFGHTGEEVLKEIVREKLGKIFWHEQNGLRFVDKIETLEDPNGFKHNLNLTYAVRDGIICHCGEVDENALFPRSEYIDLEKIKKPNEAAPYTWEGCVVKLADKISYLGRDIEDAGMLNILTKIELRELKSIIKVKSLKEINNTSIIHEFIINLCENSSPETGIRLSDKYINLMKKIKKFNYEFIYKHERLRYYKDYAKIVISSLFSALEGSYNGKNTIKELQKKGRAYPILTKNFADWLVKYSNINNREHRLNKYRNKIIYEIGNKEDYYQAIIDFISGMTDYFANNAFKELTAF